MHKTINIYIYSILASTKRICLWEKNYKVDEHGLAAADLLIFQDYMETF